jgi:hypothetical protein
MAWYRVRLSEGEQRVVAEERCEHPHEPTRRKMEVLWLLHHGLNQEKVAKIVGIGVATVKRYANASLFPPPSSQPTRSRSSTPPPIAIGKSFQREFLIGQLCQPNRRIIFLPHVQFEPCRDIYNG